MNTRTLHKISDQHRLAALDETGLLDSPEEESFDRLTRLASLVLNAPVSLVSLVDVDRQFFKSMFGLTGPAADARQTPLSHSFCQYVVADSSPLVVEDARKHPVLRTNGAVADLNVIAYLGIPLQNSEGVDLGSFCVIDSKPRQWSERDIEIVRELAKSVMTEIELRAQIKARQQIEENLIERNRKYRRVYLLAERTIEHMQETINLGAEPDEIKVYLNEMQRELQRLHD